MRQNFEICEILEFWREILKYYTYRPRVYSYTYKPRVFSRQKNREGIVFTNADPRCAGKLDDPQGSDATILMQQVRKVMTVNQEMTDESNWIWLTSEQIGFELRSEFANENQGEAGSSKQCNDQHADQTAFFLAPIITDFIRNAKIELYDEKLEDALEMLDLEWSKDDDTKTQCNRLNTSPLPSHRKMRPTRMVQHG